MSQATMLIDHYQKHQKQSSIESKRDELKVSLLLSVVCGQQSQIECFETQGAAENHHSEEPVAKI